MSVRVGESCLFFMVHVKRLVAWDREEWKKLVVKSTAMPQQSARLRDRADKIRSLAQESGY